MLKLTKDPIPIEMAVRAPQSFTDSEPISFVKQLSFTTIFSRKDKPSIFKFTTFSKLLEPISKLFSFVKIAKSIVCREISLH